MIQLTDREFMEKFRPEMEGNCWPRQREYPEDAELLDQATRENRVWTYLDCGEINVLASGNHFVNRLYYVITEVPWDQDYELPDDYN